MGNDKNLSRSLSTQQRFLGILPKIRTHAKVYFRHVRCRYKRDDLIAETVALAFKWFKSLDARGKDATLFPSTLASYAAKAVRCGRKLCGQVKAKDALNELTQQRRGFVVTKLPDYSTLSENPLQDALQDNTLTPIPDQVHFRVDYPAWRRTRSNRDKRLIDAMALNERTMNLSRQFKISPARISQLRREFHDSWILFTDDSDPAA